MAGYVGADGIRGKVSESLTVYKVFLTGRYVGELFRTEGRSRIVIGKDTRISSDMLESAFAAGAASQGCDVLLAGVVPTPVIAWLAKSQDFAGGVMITGSHNLYMDNGILLFNGKGDPIGPEAEEKLENYIGGLTSINYAEASDFGRIHPYPEGADLYCSWITSVMNPDLSGKRIAVDLANGSASSTVPRVLKALGAEVIEINHQPDGLNINQNCGTSFPQPIQAIVAERNCDCGLLFDGSADRAVMVDRDGSILDGDHMLYILITSYHRMGKEGYDRTALTIASNSGTVSSLQKQGISVRVCRAGMRNLLTRMMEEDIIAGAENNGHIILREFAGMPDGLLASLAVLKVSQDTGRLISEMLEGLNLLPYIFSSYRVVMKTTVIDDAEVQAVVNEVQELFGANGRVILRAGATEPVVRVLCEAEDAEVCRIGSERIAEVIQRRFGTEDAA